MRQEKGCEKFVPSLKGNLRRDTSHDIIKSFDKYFGLVSNWSNSVNKLVLRASRRFSKKTLAHQIAQMAGVEPATTWFVVKYSI